MSFQVARNTCRSEKGKKNNNNNNLIDNSDVGVKNVEATIDGIVMV